MIKEIFANPFKQIHVSASIEKLCIASCIDRETSSCCFHKIHRYRDHGHLELIHRQMLNDLRNWRETHNKPILVSKSKCLTGHILSSKVTEYGADTVAGLHSLPSVTFSEEFQDDFISEYFRAFDDAKAEGWFIGEMVWNFADFITKQEVKRVAGNKKRIFTR